MQETQLLKRLHLTYRSFQIYFRWLAICSLTQPPSIGLDSDDASTRSKSQLKQFEKLYIPKEGGIITSSLRIIQHGRIRPPCASKIYPFMCAVDVFIRILLHKNQFQCK